MNKFKKIFSILIIATLSVGLIGCGGAKPSKGVSEYFNEVKKGDKGKSNDLIKDSMEEVSDENAEVDELSEEVSNLLSESLKNLDYKINNETIDGEKATVNVTVEGDNISMALANSIVQSFGLLFEAAFTNPNMTDEESDKIMNNAMLENFKILTSDKRTGDITLNKVEKEWIIESNKELNRLVLGEVSMTDDNSNR